jgi:hypothetical protein
LIANTDGTGFPVIGQVENPGGTAGGRSGTRPARAPLVCGEAALARPASNGQEFTICLQIRDNRIYARYARLPRSRTPWGVADGHRGGPRPDPAAAAAICGVRRQRAVEQQVFVVAGETALKPLTRAEVAAALDLPESTVSRAVADKFALLRDRATVPLFRFFGVSGGVDGELRKLLESADGPMSDQRLADRLREAGYPIARRTVAKHRAARLGFAASPLR